MQDLFVKKYDCAAGCPVEATLDLIDGKWKAIILYHLLTGTLRFNELRRRLAKITQRMLARQLRELEEVGLVSRTIFAEVPPRVEYALTAHGQSLEPVIRALWVWGDAYLTRRSQGSITPVAVKHAKKEHRPVVADRAVR
ncbi:helix-turn-helix domain-containing protein [Bradyrhizobium sp. LTSP885]|uniref:winged helix-turn-helix transcriptional regulator n=1 Tax=Bradyrhizobium sp. LTSP885 TaxID=1619232 RepID=UPI0009E64313|nr:helix-turn-helix domain-containing protein [Bradyrhizobium sp. LTSP885]